MYSRGYASLGLTVIILVCCIENYFFKKNIYQNSSNFFVRVLTSVTPSAHEFHCPDLKVLRRK